MKIIAIVSLVLAGLLVVLSQRAEYWLGYYETPQAFAASDPIFLLMAECVLFLIFFVFALATIFLKRHRLWMVGCLVVYWPLVVLVSFLTKPGGELVLQGLHDRVMHDFTFDDLRHFAKDIDEAGFIRGGDWINHGDISSLTDQQKEAFARIRTKYAFMQWMDDKRFLHGPSILNQGDDNVVNFEWGGALPGHWGCSISINGTKNNPDPATFRTLRVSDDIYFFYE